MQKKHIFTRETSGDLLLNEKLKKPFVSLSDEVTINNTLISYYRFTRTSKALNQPDLNLFCHVTGLIRGRPIFFFSFCSFTSFENQDVYLKKKLLMKLGSGNRSLRQVIVMWNTTCELIEHQSKCHSDRKEMWRITALLTNILSIVFKYLAACLVVDRHHKALINP